MKETILYITFRTASHYIPKTAAPREGHDMGAQSSRHRGERAEITQQYNASDGRGRERNN